MVELEQLREEVARLREGNKALRERLELERQNRGADDHDSDHGNIDLNTCKAQIRKHDSNAVILRLHEELIEVRRRSTIYANALEEARARLSQMRRLYGELNAIMSGCDQ
ncbi:hypothetical protein ERJ75_001003500 [Trypanosoma vivax]|uniref:Uncharacterized protein n=1 Tax=Trypanosoma vivax (strain Y486) TaxID=1055687 RepID=G0UB05_TRYVY|nr:hypothetical protein TRVL_02554 [Trypanosoma vivax]KAH8612007.1 hypothetical protein ERJ75_001003500 [Trypanosoma vivax]CCC52992.1 conserved hypothetical protein [Trypanosoma vivax Y486]